MLSLEKLAPSCWQQTRSGHIYSLAAGALQQVSFAMGFYQKLRWDAPNMYTLIIFAHIMIYTGKNVGGNQ